MSKDAKLERRRTKRRNNTVIAKEEQFIADYIRHKYPAVYEEASGVCLQLKAKYPEKCDWRKTAEHKAWLIKGVTTEHPIFYINALLSTNLIELQKAATLANIQRATILANPLTSPQTSITLTTLLSPQAAMHPSGPEPPIPVPPPGPEPSIPVPPPGPEPQIPEPLNTPSPEPLIPEPLNTPSPEPQSPEPQIPEPLNTPSPEPLIPEPLNTPSPEPQSPEPPIPEPLNTPSPEPPIPEPLNAPSPEPPRPKSLNTQYSDNMQLIIPLLKPPVKHVGLITETLEIVTEEILQGDEQPTNFDQIDPQIIEKMIEELRADPDLKDMFSKVEQQFEVDMDMDIDIELDTSLNFGELYILYILLRKICKYYVHTFFR